MTRINTNIASLVAQNRLGKSNRDLNTALTRLSTGLRINSGSDDPAGLIASESLRSEIASLGKAIVNTERATQIINTADSALGEVSNLLNDIRGLITEAANTGALSNEEIAANQLQIDSSLEAINRIAQTTTFQGRKLLDGSLDFVTDASKVESIRSLSIDQANLGTTGQIDVEVVINAAAEKADVTAGAGSFTAAANANATIGTAPDTITISADTAGYQYNNVAFEFVDSAAHGDNAPTGVYDDAQKVMTITYNSAAATATNRDNAAIAAAITATTDAGGGTPFSGATAGTATTNFVAPTDAVSTGLSGGQTLAGNVVFQLNGTDGAETFNFAAGTDAGQLVQAINLVSNSTGVASSFGGGELSFQSLSYGTSALVNIDVIDEQSGGTFAQGLSDTRAVGKDIDAAINGVSVDGSANTLSINTATLDLSIDVTEGSQANFSFAITGGGALFQIGPDVVSTQQARLGIGSVSTGQLGGPDGRLYLLGSGQDKSLTGDIVAGSRIIDSVIDKITALRGRLGAFQSTTLNSNLVSVNETLSNLQSAESSIRDADFAVESANLTRAQILVQSGTNVLSLANQSPQNVLSLLQ